jgi:pyruvate dehydrogenase E1 component
MLKKTSPDLDSLRLLEERLRWLSAWTIHNANHLRESSDGLKVGGHQASCASMTAIMAALYFHALGPNDKVAVKPHAGPVLHAIHYLLGSQSREQLETFRGFGGAQSYPSRTKDRIPVDFSTGSVGLGVAVTAFASLVQDYLLAHGMIEPADAGRMVALMGDAELDEGNIYECLIEAYKHDIRNCWWIVDYNRQSLDATTAERMFRRFDEIFASCGWRVVTLKYGKAMEAAFAETGGEALKLWIDDVPNADYAALSYLGGAAWRKRLGKDAPETRPILDARDDEALHALMTNLAGHDMAALVEAFDGAQDDVPTLFIAYTVKGFGLPFAGHKDNHAGLMNPGQIAALREKMGIAEGEEWEPWAGLGGNAAEAVRSVAENSRIARAKRDRAWLQAEIPVIVPPAGEEQSTQAAFGKILLDISRAGGSLAERIVTTSPDVTVSTNLGAWVNQRGLFRRQELADVFAAAKIPSAQKWGGHQAGQHIELGIAENNLFLMLAALGLAGDLFGQRLFPIGTVYDPFIARGLDALNYACYQDARFLLVATPSRGHAGAGRRRPPIDQPAAHRHGPARPSPLRARLRRRARSVHGGGVPAHPGAGRRKRLPPPHHPHRHPNRAPRRKLEGRRPRRRLLAPRTRTGRRSRPHLLRRHCPRSPRRLGSPQGRRPRPRPPRSNLPRPPPPRLERAPQRPVERKGRLALPCRAASGAAGTRCGSGHPARRIAGIPLLARRSPRPAGQPARHRAFRPDR